MQSTRVQFTPELRSRLAAAHNSVLYPVKNWDLPAFAGAGGIRSTAHDLLTFLGANLGLARAELVPALQLANTPQRPAMVSNVMVGLGWHLTSTSNGVIHWHNGQTGGYTSYLGWSPERKIGVVVLSNAAISVDDVGLHLLDPGHDIIPHTPRELPTPVPLAPEVLAQYAGRYQLTETLGALVRVDRARIFIQPTGQDEVELFARSDHQFYQREANIEIEFKKNASGVVDRLVYVEDGAAVEVKKVQ
jgi:CubicO group peptidase (beta-lactamase class C family)